MKEIGDVFTEIMPETKDGKQQMPTFFDKPTLWFVIKFKLKNIWSNIWNKK